MHDKYPGTIKYKKGKRRVNIGIIVCLIFVLYFVAYFFDFVFNKTNNLYEVVQGSTSSQFDGQYTALILRSEKEVNAEASGYVSFFVGDAVPVYVGEQNYMIDNSGELSAMLQTAAATQAVLNENDLTALKDSLYEFHSAFKANEYYDTYHFRYQIESQILDLVNSSILENAVYSNSCQVFHSAYAGIVMHYVDGFESLTTDTFEASSFEKSAYRKNIIKSNDQVQTGEPVMKVITSEDWQLVLKISNPDAFAGIGDTISLEFLKDNVRLDAEYEIVTRGGNYYCIIYLDKYMIRYAHDRYTQISLSANTKSGLKVPKTAYTQKTFYAIPVQYGTRGSNYSGIGFAVQTSSADQEQTVMMRYPDIIKTTDELYYISADDPALKYGDVIMQPDSTNTFQVAMTAQLNGVYVFSGGSTIFRLADKLGEIDGYYIVEQNTPAGVRMYDQVYVNYKDAER